MFFVYLIKSKTSGKIYIGQTINLEKRLMRHNGILPTKNSSFTNKQGENWEVLYTEQFKTRTEAKKRERELKSGKGREFLKNLIQ
ncbi:MAG: GIY-YIG nuclease family protein [Candidatus Paceibacterota bacterium]|jgi:putative endonuclease